MDPLTKSCSPTIILLVCYRGLSKSRIYPTLWHIQLPLHAFALLHWWFLTVVRKALRWKTGIPTNGWMVKNHISFKTGFGYFATRRSSFLLWFQFCQNSSSASDSSTSRTPSRPVSHSSTFSSSASSSPTVSDTKTREREDRMESDFSPVTVSNRVDERSGRPDIDQASKLKTKKPKRERGDTLLRKRGDPLSCEIPEWLQEFRDISVDDEILEHGLSRQFFSWSIFRAHIQETWGLCVITVFILISLKTEIARSVRGPKLQGHRAGDALV